jgi:dTDP-glucose pyrophosphorylase
MKNIQKILLRAISPKSSLIDALKKMDLLDVKSLIVLKDNNQFVGVLSIGDIQRAIIRNSDLETEISQVIRNNPKIAKLNTPVEILKAEMLQYRMEFIPVIDNQNIVIDGYFWEDVFLNDSVPPLVQFNLPIVIMAGGMGTRLKPLTNVLPKPLIPIGEKTILEEIFSRFAAHGCSSFYVSVNYKADFIEYYINDQKLNYNINFFRELKPLGTAGSLSLLKGKINETFFVSNCDIIIEQDYSEILDYHRSNKNLITIVAALKHFHLPYGIIETGNQGMLNSLIEKPDLTFKINSGMYILEPELLNEIPENEFFHITDLIENIKNRNGKIGVFPVSEKSWKDIGDMELYLESTKKHRIR